jgi:sigma-E factor negative regulatory protein RseC
MKEVIKHDGIIDSIEGRHIRVRILQTSACAGCKIAGHCTASEAKEKIIDVESSETKWRVGQTVMVSTSNAVARRALLLGFGLPLVLMLVVLTGMLLTGHQEETSGLLSLAVLVPYYGILWLLREKVARKVSFSIEA